MHARKFLAGLAAAAVALSVLALTSSPASAAVDPDDTPGTPVDADLVGVGSDTSQNAMFRAIGAYNAQSPAPAHKFYTYAATGGGTIPVPGGDITRPNGSGAGKALLFGASNNTHIDFARSSSANSTAENTANLFAFPFALDTLVMVTSGNVASHAPAALTTTQLLDIYKGNVTNWSAIGGTAGTIKPRIPQAGSGTRSFFLAQLKALNGNVDVVLGAGVGEVQEHDPLPIQNDADVIAPFSKGRAGLSGTALRVETGFSADRALYNVVRQADLVNPDITAMFGSDGFLCSDKATASIEAAGFKQFSKPTAGGECGAQTQGATSNFTTSIVNTTTTVTVTSASASSAKVVAKVAAGSAPNGRVTFTEGGVTVAANVPLVSGQATITPSAAPGVHTYAAHFTPSANSSFQPSDGIGSGTVQKATSTLKAAFPKTVKFGKKAKGTVTVTLNGSSSKATGTVTIKDGSKVVGTGTLSNGKVTITLKKKLKPGKHKLKVSWAGDANAAGSETTVKIKALAKPKPKS
jgi:ABC-type phosphate transport system substrate-binding protein